VLGKYGKLYNFSSDRNYMKHENNREVKPPYITINKWAKTKLQLDCSKAMTTVLTESHQDC